MQGSCVLTYLGRRTGARGREAQGRAGARVRARGQAEAGLEERPAGGGGGGGGDGDGDGDAAASESEESEDCCEKMRRANGRGPVGGAVGRQHFYLAQWHFFPRCNKAHLSMIGWVVHSQKKVEPFYHVCHNCSGFAQKKKIIAQEGSSDAAHFIFSIGCDL
jgi:hypothetical protein